MTRLDVPQSACLFALAIRDITPPVGIYHRMWGAARHDRSTGVHRPLRSSVLVFSDLSGESRRVLVALDHCLLMRPAMERLTAEIVEGCSIRPDELVVTFSHTHAAGLMDPGREDLPGGELIAPYLETLSSQVVESINEALDSQTPVVITYATGRCALAAFRDLHDDELGAYVCGFDPSTPADDTVLTARVTTPDDRTLATIVNYACHPTTLAWDNELISPDYPGALRELVEESTGSPCVFLLGASGDLGPRHGFVGDAEVADRNGRQLGYAALESTESTPPSGTAYEYDGPVISGATIGTWSYRKLDEQGVERTRRFDGASVDIELPYRADLASIEETRASLAAHIADEKAAREAGEEDAASRARALGERMTRQAARLEQLPRDDAYPYHASIWRMGDAIWVAVEGEPYNLLQTTLRERFAGVPIIVSVLASGWGPCYLPTTETYGKGIYQENASIVARGSLETVIDEIGRAIGEMLEP
jgi:hypothetical protein